MAKKIVHLFVLFFIFFGGIFLLKFCWHVLIIKSESFVLQNALYETIWIAFFVAFFFTFVNKFNVFDKK